MRQIEFGPGARLPGFETLDIVAGPHIDHVADAGGRLPFADGEFGLIYASHIIEHFPWYRTTDVLKEWRRVLAPGGSLEVWTVNALVVAKHLLDAEEKPGGANPDPWSRFNPDRNPYLWAAGRLFAYEKEQDGGQYNWHRALFTPRHLTDCLMRAGFSRTRPMKVSEVRGHNHGAINLGIQATR